MDLLLFFLSGSFAGIMAGLLGIGGGAILVPIFSAIFSGHMHIPPEMVMHMAAGSALSVMIFTSATSVWGHTQHGSKAWLYFRQVVVFLISGIIGGAILADLLPTIFLKRFFGFFLLLTACEVQFGRFLIKKRLRQSLTRDRLVILVIGILSGLLGIGGGTLIIPYLSRCRIPLRKCVSIAALCSFTVGLVGTVTVIVTGMNNTYQLPWSSGYVYWPAALLAALPSILFTKLATSWLYYLRLKYLRAFFVIFLLCVGFRMII